ncbi:MAG: copper transporter [Tissierellales bacterium]
MTSIKYFVLTIVSVFLALAVGIYIGFMFDAQDILKSQKEDIVAQLEERFDYLEEENKTVKEEIIKVTKENEQIKEFNRVIYSDVIKDKLSGVKIAVIETSEDYIYKSIIQTLEAAGAEVTSITTIKNSFDSNLDILKRAYVNAMEIESIDNNILQLSIKAMIQDIINGENNRVLEAFNMEGMIDAEGIYLTPVDYLVIAGGRKARNEARFEGIDGEIIDLCKNLNVPVIGVEKASVQVSYIDKYKDRRISSIDNVDTIIGRVALVLAIDGRPGNYGIKPSAESLIPDLGIEIVD